MRSLTSLNEVYHHKKQLYSVTTFKTNSFFFILDHFVNFSYMFNN